MKVGIITYFHFYNYGTMLQAYALERICANFGKGIDCEIIDYRFGEKTKWRKWDRLIIRIKRSFVYVKEFKRVKTTYSYKNRMNRRRKFFDDFLSEHFRLSPVKYFYKEELTVNPPCYDIYITGSDQTWSPKIGFNSALFLDFAPREARKAAYAPSVGVTSFTREEEEYLREHLERYDYLSCRETTGARLLADLVKKEVNVVLDPTLMITGDEWRKLAIAPNLTRPYILCYFLGERQYYREFVQRLKAKTGYDVYFLPVSWVDCKHQNHLLFDAGPAEFIGLIDHAAVVCTDSFHGMCFSINLEKFFYGFVKHKGAVDGGDNSRIYDLLQRTGLTSRLLSDDVLEQEWNVEDIDYEFVNQQLDNERRRSASYLNKVLYDYD